MFLSLSMLIFQIKRISSSEKWFNYLVTFFFFCKCQKFRSSDGAKTEKKKEDGHENKKNHFHINGFALSLALKKRLGDITFRYKIKIITI